MNWIVNTYWPEVRGNVYAILPCAVVAFLWLRSKHAAIQAAHERLHGKLDDVLDKWDPDSDGGTYRATVTFDPQPATSSTATAATIRRFIEPPLGFDVLQVLTDRTDTVRGVLIQPV